MTLNAPYRVASEAGGPWLWGRRIDLGVFVLPTIVGLVASGIARAANHDHLPDWGWVAVVVGVDVAHVWSTLFRTYFDPIELRRRAKLYTLTPLACWVAGVFLHARSPILFWRVLAYTAVFHFVRQQVGWAAVYRARSGATTRRDRLVDDAAIYLAAGAPLLLWHARMPRRFAWFLEGDFVSLPVLEALAPFANALLIGALLVFAWHHLMRARKGEPVPLGKIAVVATTAIGWYVGIVLANDDVTFTLLNVLPHGVPYVALLWAYSHARRREAPRILASRILAGGLGAFLGVILACAFAEEMLWDGLVWHDRPWLFGTFWPDGITGRWNNLLLPLLALPQATHYVLDAVLWRRRDAGAAQAAALGFRSRRVVTTT